MSVENKRIKTFQFNCANCDDIIEIQFIKNKSTTIVIKLENFIGVRSTMVHQKDMTKFEATIREADWSSLKKMFRTIPNIECGICNLPYCKNCWSNIETQYGDEYDRFLTATCPKGHNCVIDQVI